MQGKWRENMTPEQARDGRLVRRSDAYDVLGRALEDAVARGTLEYAEQDIQMCSTLRQLLARLDRESQEICQLADVSYLELS